MQRYSDSLHVFTALTSFLEAKLAQAALLAPAEALAVGADVNEETIAQGELTRPSLESSHSTEAEGAGAASRQHAHSLLHQVMLRTSRLGTDAERFDRLRRLSAARHGRASLLEFADCHLREG